MDDTNKLEKAPARSKSSSVDANTASNISSDSARKDGMTTTSVAPSKLLEIKPSQADLDAAIEEHSDIEHTTKKETGPKLMNAFDLINMCGGMALNRMFQSFDDKRVKRSSQFTSTLDATSILQRITDHMRSMPGYDAISISIYIYRYILWNIHKQLVSRSSTECLTSEHGENRKATYPDFRPMNVQRHIASIYIIDAKFTRTLWISS